MSEKIALITGASSGIGAAYSQLLAEKGFDLWITGRREDKLKKLAASIRKDHKVKVEIIIGDLSKEKDLKILEQKIAASNHLAVLINNAGYGFGEVFEESPVKLHLDMHKVHMDAPVRLAHAAAQTMISQGNGYIMNIASIAGIAAHGGSVSYSATKAFLIRFSECLYINLKDKGIKVMAQCPGFTHTDFHEKMGMDEASKLRWSKRWMTAEKVARSGWKAINRGKAVSIPGFFNKLMIGILHLLPARLYFWIALKIYRSQQ